MSESKIKGKEGLAVKSTCGWAGELAQWLSVLAALTGNSGPVRSTHRVAHNIKFQGSIALF